MTVATLGELAQQVQGLVRGDESCAIEIALPLQDVVPNACITLIDRVQAAELLQQSGATAAVVPMGFPETSIPVIEVARPHDAFEAIIRYLRPQIDSRISGIHPSATIDPSASIGKTA